MIEGAANYGYDVIFEHEVPSDSKIVMANNALKSSQIKIDNQRLTHLLQKYESRE